MSFGPFSGPGTFRKAEDSALLKNINEVILIELELELGDKNNTPLDVLRNRESSSSVSSLKSLVSGKLSEGLCFGRCAHCCERW